MRKLRHREDELVAHGQLASKWQSWDLNVDLLALESQLLITLLNYTYTKAFSHVLTHAPPSTYCPPCHMGEN